jgi:uncharacterized protein
VSFDAFAALAEPHAANLRSTIHGLDHARAVQTIGRTLARDTTGADLAVVDAFAAFHDALRVRDDDDPQHGPRAADLIRDLHAAGRLPLDDVQAETLSHAIERHTLGETTDDPTVGVAWDADRLDLVRLGRPPFPALMSTRAGRREAEARRSAILEARRRVDAERDADRAARLAAARERGRLALNPAGPFLHGGVPGLDVGDMLEPGHRRKPAAPPAEWVAFTVRQDYARRFAAAYPGGGDLYLVEPVDRPPYRPLEDFDGTGDGGVIAWACGSARIVGVVERGRR